MKIQGLVKQYRKECILAAAVLLAFVCARFQKDVADATLSGALLLVGCSAYIVLDLKSDGKWERRAILCGYVLRVALILFTVFALDSLSIINAPDSSTFYRVSLRYFTGDFSFSWTKYPYVIYVCHLLFGAGRPIPLYLNVFCWYLCWKVIRTAARSCGEGWKIVFSAYWAFLPANIWLSSELLRESIMGLFIALSFFFLLRWMDGGSWHNIAASLLCSFPAIWLHTVSIALWGGIGFAIVFWDRGKQRLVMGKRNVILLIAAGIIVFCFFYFNLYRLLPHSYIPADLSWRMLSERVGRDQFNGGFAEGRSDYLRGVAVNNVWQFAFWTVVRCVYFWLSPVVFDWNLWTDPAVALVDALPLAALIVLTFLRPRQKGDGKFLAGVVALLCYTLMFAWAVSNAGTAMRHRNLLLSLLLMTCAARHTTVERYPMKEVFLMNYTGRRGGGPLDAFEMAQALVNRGVPVAALLSRRIENLDAWRKLKLEKLVLIDTYGSVAEFAARTLLFPFVQRKQIIEAFRGYRITDVYCPMVSVWNPLILPIFRGARKSAVIHDPYAHPGEKLNYLVQKSTYGKYDILLVHSRKFVELVREQYGRPTYYLPLGRHNFYKSLPNKQKAIEYEPEKVNFLFFGRISEYKGLELLAEAYRRVRERAGVEISLTVIGSGDFEPYRKLYEGLPDTRVINRWILDEEVESAFTGENIVCVCPYREATQSGVVLLAMDYGAVVIASNSGAIDEQIIDGETGLLFTEDSVEALTEAMDRVARDAALRKSLSEHALRAAEELTWDNSAKELTQILRVDPVGG